MDNLRVRCPCCDSIFSVEVSNVTIIGREIILDKVHKEKQLTRIADALETRNNIERGK